MLEAKTSEGFSRNEETGFHRYIIFFFSVWNSLPRKVAEQAEGRRDFLEANFTAGLLLRHRSSREVTERKGDRFDSSIIRGWSMKTGGFPRELYFKLLPLVNNWNEEEQREAGVKQGKQIVGTCCLTWETISYRAILYGKMGHDFVLCIEMENSSV